MKKHSEYEQTATQVMALGPTDHPPGSLESLSRYYENDSVYRDTAEYCSITMPKDLGRSIYDAIHTIDCARYPDIKTRTLLQIAKSWKDMAPRLQTAESRGALVSLLSDINSLGDKRACLCLASLRRIIKDLDPNLRELDSSTELPLWTHGTASDDLLDDSGHWSESKFGLDLIARCEALVEIEDSRYVFKLSGEGDEEELEVGYTTTWDNVGNTVDPSFWVPPWHARRRARRHP